MMNAETAYVDEPSSEILFTEGIIGVARARRFQLLERPDSPVRILRCLDINGFALPVIDPRLADPEYRPEINPRVLSAIGADADSPVLMLAVATFEDDGTVANLRAPLMINVASRVGAQVILDDRKLPLRAKVRTEK